MLNFETADVPVIDLMGFRDSSLRRSMVVKDIGNACRRFGFFQITNHGIDQFVLDGALSSAFDFFSLPTEEKASFMSNDVHKPVRYVTSSKDEVDKIQFGRVFLKQYAYPLEDWVKSWPENPPAYREQMGRYAVEVRKLALEIIGAITESLGIGPKYLSDKMEEGMQVMASATGLEILGTEDGKWRVIPELKGTLQVLVGDHFEVLSNGMYKSVVHRATLVRESTRISIASFHSLGMDEKMETAEELVDEEHPKGYKKSSFRDFLNFLAKNDTAEVKAFIESLKIQH
ncbi:hypothetical protein Vadar_003577 [Vaccinium darrowii]|uniref:Uncharacterized protein n=1 Tax=Vaccinium darrowii TaxID=229202 RepID=A0ACB7YL07_9ERIC|nr:hypothetical protein Vadar_003577 [Vaccinium darrowii]